MPSPPASPERPTRSTRTSRCGLRSELTECLSPPRRTGQSGLTRQRIVWMDSFQQRNSPAAHRVLVALSRPRSRSRCGSLGETRGPHGKKTRRWWSTAPSSQEDRQEKARCQARQGGAGARSAPRRASPAAMDDRSASWVWVSALHRAVHRHERCGCRADRLRGKRQKPVRRRIQAACRATSRPSPGMTGSLVALCCSPQRSSEHHGSPSRSEAQKRYAGLSSLKSALVSPTLTVIDWKT
jgi:hypothetical protein